MANVNPHNGVTSDIIRRAEAIVSCFECVDYDPQDVANALRVAFDGECLNEHELMLAYAAGLTSLVIEARFPFKRDC